MRTCIVCGNVTDIENEKIVWDFCNNCLSEDIQILNRLHKEETPSEPVKETEGV